MQAVSAGLKLHLLLEVTVALGSRQTDLHWYRALIPIGIESAEWHGVNFKGLVVTFVGSDDVGLAVHFHGLDGIGMAEGHEASVPQTAAQNGMQKAPYIYTL